uniref:Reverse transcriptase domain-containing protein n=3 Tax=Aegilops tauschii subsp. strangulata TaxID=200361 RepID=A0A453A1Z5_AEGTS
MDRKKETWRMMRLLKQQHQGGRPWLCLGDFNEILTSLEKAGGAARPQHYLDGFREALQICELGDIGFEGDIFTWRNHSKELRTYICERLDRATSNEEWCEQFPAYTVVNGPPRHSDHRPIIVDTEGPDKEWRRGDGRFRFEARWLQEEGCEEVVRAAWERSREMGDATVAVALQKVAGDISTWSKDVVGELEGRLKRVKKELEGCMRTAVTEHKINEEARLRCLVEELEEKKHTQLKQRAHMWWLKDDNRNIKYLESVASARKKTNRIKELRKEDGSVVEAGEEMTNYVCLFFQELFSASSNPQRLPELLEKVQPRVTEAMNNVLLADFTREEVKAALDHIGDLKAPGPDGMPSIVFKRHWHFMGDQIVEEVLRVLNGGDMPEGWNDTHVVLIPKVKNPQRIKDLRPISLCNVLYKLVSKVIANRLKMILPSLISDNQSTFVPGRLITDNVLIAYELSHYVMNKRSGKDGYTAVKADMSKAYDRVEWCFLEAMMCRMGFRREWVDLIMKCVRTVRYQVKVNGELTHQFCPSRGLRQGDPASPYLFVICAEGLSALLNDAEQRGRISGIKVMPESTMCIPSVFCGRLHVIDESEATGSRGTT